MYPIKLSTKRIFPNVYSLKINRMMSFCNLFMERPGVIVLNVSFFLLFLIFCISQGNVGKRLRCDGKCTEGLAENLLIKFISERIWKIRQHLTKLCVKL